MTSVPVGDVSGKALAEGSQAQSAFLQHCGSNDKL